MVWLLIGGLALLALGGIGVFVIFPRTKKSKTNVEDPAKEENSEKNE